MEKDEVKKLGSSEILNLITSILQNTTGVNALLLIFGSLSRPNPISKINGKIF